MSFAPRAQLCVCVWVPLLAFLFVCLCVCVPVCVWGSAFVRARVLVFCWFVAWLVGGWSVGGGGFGVAVGLVVCWVGGLLFLFLCALVGWWVVGWLVGLCFGGLVVWCLVGWWVGGLVRCWFGGLVGWFGWLRGVGLGGWLVVWCAGGLFCGCVVLSVWWLAVFVRLVGWWSCGSFVLFCWSFVGSALLLGFLLFVRLCSFLFVNMPE